MNTAAADLTDQPLARVQLGATEIVLLGTAHVSRRSADAVRELLTKEHFDAVAVELCDARHNALTDPDAWAKLNLFDIIRQGKGGLVAANLALGAYQRRIAEQFGIEPGAEMRAAIEEAQARDIETVLIDRDVGTTLKRVFRQVGLLEKMSMLSGLVFGLVSGEEITEEEIEKLKEGDMLEATFSEFALQSKNLYNALIHERDLYMAAKLRQAAASEAAPRRILAVIGAGHLAGIREALTAADTDNQALIERLEQTPPPSLIFRALPWLITIAILTGFGIGFSRSPELGWELVTTWVVINGGLAALGAAIAGGHVLTVLSGFLAAPLTSLNPAVAAGFVTATVEAWLRKPTVGDFASLKSSVSHLGGWWKNRVTRTLMVLVFSNIGSMLGTWIAGLRIAGRLT